jgi:anti-anti-sigma factor
MLVVDAALTLEDGSADLVPAVRSVCGMSAGREIEGAVAHLELGDHASASIVIDGDFDIAGEPHARMLVREVVDAHIPEVEIDFCNANFADCSAVRLALHAREQVSAYGGALRVRAPEPVQRVFDLTRTSRVVELVRC